MSEKQIDIEKFDSQALREFGSTGLHESAGFVFEDHLPKLRSKRKRISTYKEMATDSTVGAILFAVEMHLRNVDFEILSNKENDDERRKVVKDSISSLNHSFQDFMSEVSSMLTYGFALHEIVYKIDDRTGNAVWKKFAPRSQDSLYKWDINDQGDIEGFIQMPKYSSNQVYIPMKKCLLFRPATHKMNPEGKSALRTAYRPWYFKTRLETIEAIGLERNLSGYPVMHVPTQVFSNNEKARELRNYAEKIVSRIRKDSQMGSVLPPNWELELLSADGSSNSHIGEAINRYKVEIAQSLLSDIIMLGHGAGGGSFALSDKKYELFVIALESWVQSIFDKINQKAIPQLMRLNGLDDRECPYLSPSPVEKMDPLTLANALFRFANINAIKPDDQLEKYLREFMGLPEKDTDTERHPDAQPSDYPGGHTASQDRKAGTDRTDNMTRPTDASGDYEQSETQNLS